MSEEYIFDGDDYQPDRDNDRLAKQLDDIMRVILDGNWYTLSELSAITGHPPASISAQLRHLRKKRFGSWTVERRYCGSGLYEYRLVC